MDGVVSKTSKKAYDFTFFVKDSEEFTLTPLSDDNLFQYEPKSSTVDGITNCDQVVASFRAVKVGLFYFFFIIF